MRTKETLVLLPFEEHHRHPSGSVEGTCTAGVPQGWYSSHFLSLPGKHSHFKMYIVYHLCVEFVICSFLKVSGIMTPRSMILIYSLDERIDNL